MMKLYTCLGSGNCMKPWLLLNQLDMDAELILIDVLKGEQKLPSFLAINPAGVVPYLETGTGHGIGESNAMLWYLAEGTHLMPPTAENRADALKWMFFEQTKLEPFISRARFFSFIMPEQRDARREEIACWQEQAHAGLIVLEDHLANTEFVVSSGYSIADIAIFGYVHLIEEAGIDANDYPNLTSWIARVSKTNRFTSLSQLGVTLDQAA